MSKKKILILTNNDAGLYNFRNELLMVLIARGFDVVISLPDGKFIDKLEKEGCICERTMLERRGKNPLSDMHLMKQYGKLIKKHHPDIILTYTIKPNIYGAFMANKYKIPCITNITGLGTALEKRGIGQYLLLGMYRVALKKVQLVFFQNEDNKNFMLNHKCIKGRIRLIPGSGVNLEEHALLDYPNEEDKIQILHITRIMRDKGIGELLAVIPDICAKYSNAIFIILGYYEKESQPEYEPLIESLQQKGMLTYEGYHEDVSRYMLEASMVVNPSYHEGMSNVLLEAAAAGRPVVASDISGCRETYIEGNSGIGCEPQNADSLKKALEKMLNKTKDERKQMGLIGRQHVEKNFDRKKVVDIYMEEIDNIVNANLKQKRAK